MSLSNTQKSVAANFAQLVSEAGSVGGIYASRIEASANEFAKRDAKFKRAAFLKACQPKRGRA